MSIRTVITRGFGAFGTIADVVRRGYSSATGGVFEKCEVDIITTMTPSETDVIARITENVDTITRMTENVDIITTMTPSETDIITRIVENVDIITEICRV